VYEKPGDLKMTDYYLKLTSTEIDASLDDARTPTAHATSHKSGGTDAIKLNELAAPDNVTTLNVTTSRPGLCPILPNDSTKFLNGVGAYTVPVGGNTITYPGTPTAFLAGSEIWKAPVLSELAAPPANSNTNLLATSTYPGLMPKLNDNSSYFLSGAGTWVYFPFTDEPLPSAYGTVYTVGPAGSGATYTVDGTNDDVQINLAIQTASAGDTVYLLAATYDIRNIIYMKSGITLKGQGIFNTILKVNSAALGTFNVGDAAIIELYELDDVDIHSLKIDGNDGEYSHCGFGWENAIQVHHGGSNLTIHDIYIVNINGDGIRVTPINSGIIHKNANIYNFRMIRSGHDGIRAHQVDNWKISNMYCEVYINYGVRFWDATNCSISNSTFFATVGSGNAAVGFDGDCPGLNIHHNRFQDMHSATGYRIGVYATLGSGAVTISNNVFDNCENGGIEVDDAASQTFTVTQNVFDGCDFAFNNLEGIVTNNIITDSVSFAAKGAGTKLCTFTDNNVYGADATVSYVTESGTISTDPYYNATAGLYIPLQASAPLYDIMESWVLAGFTAF